MDFYQHLIFMEGRLFRLFEMKNIWWSVFCVIIAFLFYI
jgi:hypothetical protein